MKICLDFRKYDGVMGGVEQVVLQILAHVTAQGHHFVVLCKQSRQEEVAEILADYKNIKLQALDTPTHTISKHNKFLDANTIQDIAEHEEADIIHFPYNWSFPAKKKKPCILTVHDVIPFTFREAMPFFTNRFVYRPAIRKACRLNDVVTTISDFSSQDLAKKTGIPRQKIKIIPNGVRMPNSTVPPAVWEALNDKFTIGDDYIINVGGIHERKNVPRLIQAFHRLVSQHRYEGKLIITGKSSGAPYQDKMRKKCDDEIKKANLEDQVIFPGFITDDELDILVKKSQMLIYPSMYEGFGLPIIEAMRQDTPVITSKTTALPEIAGDAALLIDPLSSEDMANNMHRLLKDAELREQLIREGRNQAEKYTWEKSGSMYIDLYQSLMS